MILGHAALAVVARKTAFRAVPFPVLLFASYAPDLIDKTGMLLLRTSSKGIGHTLLLWGLVAACSCLPALRRAGRLGRMGGAGLAVALLWLSHLLLDLTGATILAWPTLGPFPVTDPYDLAEGFVAFYTGHGNTLVLALDLACLALAAALTLRPRRQKNLSSA